MFIPAEPTSAHPIALAKLTWLDCYACAYDDNIVCVDVTMLLLTNDVVSQRRLVLYIATIVVCSCNSVACQNSPHSHRFQPALRPWPSLVPKLAHATSSVAVVNAYPWCYEVLFGVVHALQLIVPTVDVYVSDFSSFQAGGAEAFLHTFHTGVVRHCDEIATFQSEYQLMVWTDHIGLDNGKRPEPGLKATLDRGFQGPIWVYIHEPSTLLAPLLAQDSNHINKPEFVHGVTEVLGHPQVEFMTIAPHVAVTLEIMLNRLDIIKHVEWALPVYPVPNVTSHRSVLPKFANKKGFALQGSTQEYRRNYTGLLADVAQARELVDDPRFELQIFAWSNLDARFVPNTLSQKLVHKPLGFLEYYQEIHESLAMMTLFPGDRYYRDAASSTVATAICAHVPMLVSRRFLDVYSFIPLGAVVVTDDTSHATAIQQILRMPSKEWVELALQMSLVYGTVLQRNVHIYAAKLEEI